MRNFEERMAEISRRSKKIFAQRKKSRRMILSACIPLVLCVGIFAFIRTGDRTPQQGIMEAQPEVFDGLTIQFSAMENNQLQLFIDQLQTQGIPVHGNGTKQDTPVAPEEDPNEAAEDSFSADSLTDEAVPLYSFSLPMADGSMNEYRLSGNILENLTTAEQYLLTDEQRDQLLALLDIE